MTEYPINIDLNVNGEESLKSLTDSLKNIETASKTGADGIKVLADALGSVKGGDGLKKIITELNNINKASTETANSVNKINFNKISQGMGNLKSIDSTLKELLSTVQSLKSAGTIQLRVETNASAANRELQTVYRTSGNVRKHTYRTGSRNGYNYYGFNADENPYYQKAAPITAVGRNMQRIGEKTSLVGANLMMAGSFLGVQELSNTIIDTPARAETQKYLLQNMQGGGTVTGAGGSPTTLYKTLDKVTDALPISMQNVVQPLYAFKAASGATAQEINDILPQFANFGAQVINMTGSEDQAEEAMQKLSRAYQGQYAAVDQYGITKESLEKVGYHEGGTIEEFMDAVTKITGDAKESMNNFNGMKALVGKDFSRAGKQLWSHGIGQTMSSLVGGFHSLDSATGGFTTQLIVAGAGFLNLATTLTTVVGSIGTTIGTFGQMWGNLQAIRKSSGGIGGAITGLFKGVNENGAYGAGLQEATDVIDNAKMQTAVYEGSLQGTLQGMNASNASNVITRKPSTPTVDVDIDDDLRKSTTPKIPPVYDTTYKGAGGKSGIENAINNKKQKDRYLTGKDYPNKSIELFYKEKEKDNLQSNASRMFDDWERAEKQATANAKNGGGPQKVKKDTGLEANAKNHKILGKHLPTVNKAFGKLSSVLGFLASPTGALLGLGTAAMAVSGWVSYASAHDDRVKDASTNLERAFGNLGNSAGDLVGDFFKNIGLSSQGGMQGLYEGTASTLNNLAIIINDITGHSEEDEKFKSAQERDAKKKEEADRTGEGFLTLNEKEFANADYYYNPKTKKAEPVTEKDELKVEAMHNQRYWGHASELNAKFWDGVVGIFNGGKGAGLYQKAHGINVEQENLIKSGDEQRLHERLGPLNFLTTAKYGKTNKEFAQAVGEWAPKLMPGALGWASGALGNMLGGSKTSAQQQAEGRQKRDASERGEQGLTTAITGLTTAFNNHPLGGLLSSLTGGGQQSNQVQQQQPQTNPLAGLLGGGQGQGQSPLGDGTQAGTDWGSQFMTGLTQGFTTHPINTDQILGQNAGNDMLMKGQEWGTNLTTGFNEGFDPSSLDIGNIGGEISSHGPEVNSAGNGLGKSGTDGFNTGFGDLSGIAGAEAGEIASALRAHIPEVKQAAFELAQAAETGFNDAPGAVNHHSPGRLAKIMDAEGDEIVKAVYTHVNPLKYASATLASSAISSFDYSGNDISSSIGANVTSSVGSSLDNVGTASNEGSTDNRNVVINNNFHIDKIDSKERVREIAETLVHIMTFNNETAGRNTDVGL